MKKILLVVSYWLLVFSCITYPSEWREDFRNGTLEQTTLSDAPGVKWKKNPSASIKLSSKSFDFKIRDWEPLSPELSSGYTEPEFGDMDNDGDLDLVVGYKCYNEITLFENIGSKYNAIFKRKGTYTIPYCWGDLTLGDIDKDGKIDLLATYYPYDYPYPATSTKEIHGYRINNWVLERNLEWDILLIPHIPLENEYIWLDICPDLADLDNDKDPDLIVMFIQKGKEYGYGTPTFLAYENNNGTFTRKPAWDPPSRTKITSLGSGWNGGIDLVDLDGNGAPDLVYSCDESGMTKWYKNLGTTSPIWDLPYGKVPYQLTYSKYGVSYGNMINLVIGEIICGTAGFADLDNDGDFDMLMGSRRPCLVALENIGNLTYNNFTLHQKTYLERGHITGGIAFCDLDDDGDQDEISCEGMGSCLMGNIWISYNYGSPEDARFGCTIMPRLEPEKYNFIYDIRPTIVDIDNNGKIDLFIGNYDDGEGDSMAAFKDLPIGYIDLDTIYYPQWDITGKFLITQGVKDEQIDMSSWSAFVDLNNDKKYDLIISTGYLIIFLENIGTKEAPQFRRNSEWERGFEIIHNGSIRWSVITTVADIDGDNQEDLIFSAGMDDWTGALPYVYCFKRIGTPTQVLFERREDWEEKLNYFVYPYSPLGIVDYDNDGDYELVVAYKDSAFALFINQGHHNLIGTYTSSLFDAGASVPFEKVIWYERKPSNTNLSLFIRYGNSTQTLTNWQQVSNGQSLNISARFIQWQALFSTSDPEYTPTLYEVIILYSLGNTKINVFPQSGLIGTTISVKGEGFTPHSSIKIDFGATKTIATTKANANGTFSATFFANTQSYGIIPVVAYNNKIATDYFLLVSYSYIKGYIKNDNKGPISSVTLLLSGSQTATSTTNQSGYYEFSSLSPGTYKITPSLPFYIFFPKEREYIQLTTNIEDQDFIGGIPGISVYPKSGLPGLKVEIKGFYFPPSEEIELLFGETNIGTETASNNGTFSIDFIVPSLPKGTIIITAYGKTSGFVETATFYLYYSLLSIQKSVDKQRVKIGDTIIYTISYSNPGNYPVIDAVIIDVLPEGVILKGVNSPQAEIKYWYNNGWQETFNKDATKIRWKIQRIEPEESGTIIFSVEVK